MNRVYETFLVEVCSSIKTTLRFNNQVRLFVVALELEVGTGMQ
jgi:hypothetical protein